MRENDTRAAKSARVLPERGAITRDPDRLLRHATLRQLQIFAAIVEHGSFTKASEALFVTQPTVSVQMKKLSNAVGAAIFEPVGRGMRPTDAGMRLYRAANEVFGALRGVEDWVAETRGLRRGRVSLAVVTTAKHFAPELLGSFYREYPDIEISLEVTNRDTLLDRIRAKADDLYIFGHPEEDDHSVHIHAFAPNPLVVVAGRDHPLVGKRGIEMHELADYPFILREPGSGTRKAAVREFANAGLTPTIRMEMGSSEAIKHAVIAGLGLSILSLHSLTLEGVRGPLRVLDVKGFPIDRHWWILHDRDSELSPAAAELLAYSRRYRSVLTAQMDQLLADAAGQLDMDSRT